MLLALVLILLTVGTVVFHMMSPWWWTPLASNWGNLDTTIIITFWITGVAFVLVGLFTAYCVFRFRHREGIRAEYEPENKKLELWLTGLTAVGVVGLLAPGLFVWAQYVTVPDDAKEFEVLSQQWQWSFRLPGEDGVLGTSDINLVSDDNVFGVNPDDPNSLDDVLIEADDLHLPIDQPVKVLLRSLDVVHDFYVPQFRAKMDIVPGQVTYFWFTPTVAGTYELLCLELCGVGHHLMRGYVVVDDASDYQEWLGEQSTFAEVMARGGDGADDTVRLVSNGGDVAPAE